MMKSIYQPVCHSQFTLVAKQIIWLCLHFSRDAEVFKCNCGLSPNFVALIRLTTTDQVKQLRLPVVEVDSTKTKFLKTVLTSYPLLPTSRISTAGSCNKRKGCSLRHYRWGINFMFFVSTLERYLRWAHSLGDIVDAFQEQKGQRSSCRLFTCQFFHFPWNRPFLLPVEKLLTFGRWAKNVNLVLELIKTT